MTTTANRASADLLEVRSSIDGTPVDRLQWFEVVDPATGAPIAAVGRSKAAAVAAAVAAARRASESGPWPTMAPKERDRTLRTLGELILSNREQLAALESRDKPLAQARTDVELAARYFEFYSGAIEALHGDTIPAIPVTLAYTLREPLLTLDERFLSNEGRVVHAEVLDDLIGARTAVEHPQLEAREPWQTVSSPNGPFLALRPPVDITGIDVAMGDVPGLDTESVLAWLAEISTTSIRG